MHAGDLQPHTPERCLFVLEILPLPGALPQPPAPPPGHHNAALLTCGARHVTAQPYFIKSKAPDSASLGGFYTDPNHYEAGTLKGARMLSSGGSGDTFTLVGSDDGTRFWGLTGRFTDKVAGKVAIVG